MKRASELIEFAQTTSLKYEMERDKIVNFILGKNTKKEIKKS